GYIAAASSVRRLLKAIGPDVVHAHYASGYGTLARLACSAAHILSVWGSDVYKFPRRSWLHRRVLAMNVRAASVVCSTSHAMAQELKTVVPAVPDIHVIPFGIDIDVFSPQPRQDNEHDVVFGTVKALRHVYGIDVLLKAFKLVLTKIGESGSLIGLGPRLRIVGGGPLLRDLRLLANRLGV